MNTDKIYFERKIIDLLSKDNVNDCSFHFDYEQGWPKKVSEPPVTACISVSVISYNPKTETTFLVCVADGENEEEATRHAYSIVKDKDNNNDYKSYTVEWAKNKEPGIIKSYFFAKNEYEVLEKLYYGLNKGNVVFYSMKVNPIA
jgi:hypothetical protein